MDFHGMKRRKLQTLCKKHGIPANIKSIEMANRLAALFQDQSSRDHELGKEEEERRATESHDVLNTSQNEGVGVVDESNVAAGSLRESFLGGFNEENKTDELHCESAGSTITTTSSSRLAVFGNAGNECNPEPELIVETTPSHALVRLALSNPVNKETVSALVSEEDDKINEESVVKEHSFVAKLAEAEAVLENPTECWNEIHSNKDDEKGFIDKELQSASLSEFNSHENSSAEEQADICKVGPISVGHCGNRETMDEVSALELSRFLSAELASVDDESTVFNTPERNLFMMEQLIQTGKKLASDSVNHHSEEAVESHAVVFTTPEQVLLLGETGIDEVGKQVGCDNFTGANITAMSHDMSNVNFAASESQSTMGDFEPFTAKKQEREEVEFKDESAFFTRFETCLLLGESAHGNNKSGSSHHDSSAKVILKDDSMVLGSHVPALDLGDNTVADSSGSITSKVFYSHEFSVGEETSGADFKSKGSQAEYVDSANLFDLDIDAVDTTMAEERNVSFSSYALVGTCS